MVLFRSRLNSPESIFLHQFLRNTYVDDRAFADSPIFRVCEKYTYDKDLKAQ